MVISICVHTPRKSISTSRLEKRRTSNPSAVKNAEPPGVFQLTVVLWYGHVFPSQSAAPTALPKGEPSSARNALHRTVYRSAPSLSVRQTGSCLLNLFNLNQQHHRSTHFITHSRHTHHICRRHCFLNSLNLKTTFYKWIQYLR